MATRMEPEDVDLHYLKQCLKKHGKAVSLRSLCRAALRRLRVYWPGGEYADVGQ